MDKEQLFKKLEELNLKMGSPVTNIAVNHGLWSVEEPDGYVNEEDKARESIKRLAYKLQEFNTLACDGEFDKEIEGLFDDIMTYVKKGYGNE